MRKLYAEDALDEVEFNYVVRIYIMTEEISIEAFIALKKKNKDLRKNVQRLKGTLTKINNGFKHEYGHSDADRYCSSIKYWNEIIVKALRTS